MTALQPRGPHEVELSRIVGVTRPEHARSRHVLEKLGMRYERDVDVSASTPSCTR